MKRSLLLVVILLLSGKVFSQCYTVSQINYAPDPFTAGTVVSLPLDDHYTCTLNLPFPFCFFGNTYNRFIIGSNGNVSFDTTYACSYDTWPISSAIPSASNLHKNCIMLPWEDLLFQSDTSSRICYNTYGTTPNRRFVVSFYHAPMYICDSLEFTGEVILYESSNNIEMHIQNKPLCPSWNGGYAIEGIQDATGTQAVFVPGRNYPTQWTANNDAWRFSPNCCAMGISYMDRTDAFTVYPNPSGGQLYFIMRDNYATEFSLTITDISGRVVYTDEASLLRRRELKPDIPAGAYFVQARGANGELIGSQKIIVE